jgi:putative salt-induced outer membrane protein YdiY
VTTRLRVVVAGMIVGTLSASAHAQTPPGGRGEQDEIRANEEALAAAMHRRDSARLDDLLATDYVLRSAPDVDRETWIRNALTMCWGDRSDMSGFRTRPHGLVVVATFEMTFYRNPTTCQPALLRSEITDIWIRQPDGWRLQMRHAAPPPPPDAGVVAQYGIVPAPAPTWEISSELSFVATGGNTATRTLGMGGDITHHTDHATSRGSVSYLSSQADGTIQARTLSVLAREGFEFGQRFQAFGEGAYARDQFAGIDGRTTATAGLAFPFRSSGRHRLTIEVGGGLTAEQRVDGRDRRFATASDAAHYVWVMAPGSRLSEDFAFLGDLQSGMNWRQTSVTAVTVTLSRLLSFKASHSIEYRNAPVAGFGRTDMRTSAALVLSLQQRPGVR